MGKKRRLIKTYSKFNRKYSAHPMFKRLYSEENIDTVDTDKTEPVIEVKKVDSSPVEIKNEIKEVEITKPTLATTIETKNTTTKKSNNTQTKRKKPTVSKTKKTKKTKQTSVKAI